MDFPAAYTLQDAWDRDTTIGWDPIFQTFFIRSAFVAVGQVPAEIPTMAALIEIVYRELGLILPPNLRDQLLRDQLSLPYSP